VSTRAILYLVEVSIYNMSPLNPDRLRLPEGLEVGSKSSPPKRPPRHKLGEKILKGPIPWMWLEKAARLPGRALHVAIAIWFKVGLTKDRTVRLSYVDLRRLGCKRESARRGLARLEHGGLVSVDRHPGRCPRVTVLDVRDGGARRQDC
jgi:hypothetical protein